MSGPAVVLVALATLFALVSGAKDGANSLATIITSRSMSPTWAVALVTVVEFLGPLIFGVAVATTIGTNIANPEDITITAVIAGLLSCTVWNLLMWWLGVPTSSTHALVGGLVGAILVANRMEWSVRHTGGYAEAADVVNHIVVKVT